MTRNLRKDGVAIHAYLPKNLAEGLDRLASREMIGRSALIRRLVAAAINAQLAEPAR